MGTRASRASLGPNTRVGKEAASCRHLPSLSSTARVYTGPGNPGGRLRVCGGQGGTFPSSALWAAGCPPGRTSRCARAAPTPAAHRACSGLRAPPPPLRAPPSSALCLPSECPFTFCALPLPLCALPSPERTPFPPAHPLPWRSLQSLRVPASSAPPSLARVPPARPLPGRPSSRPGVSSRSRSARFSQPPREPGGGSTAPHGARVPPGLVASGQRSPPRWPADGAGARCPRLGCGGAAQVLR